MLKYSFKPRLWPTLMTLPILISCLLLGNWQVERLDWKLDLIGKINQRAFATPQDLPSDTSNFDDLEYLHVEVTGTFDNDHELTMYSTGPNGEAGYDLYTPLINGDGQAVIINRGWVPEPIKEQETRAHTLSVGEVTISGLLRKPWEKLWFGPENEPENNMWFYGDLDGMADTMLISGGVTSAYPMYLYADKIDSDNRFPVAGRTEINIVNNHLDYAMTWYGMAIVLIVIYLIAHIRKKDVI